MKTLSISEAAGNLANWLKQAVAGEEIGIRSDDTVVALKPLRSNGTVESSNLSPREALRRLQSASHLSPAQAESYLCEVHAERITSDQCCA